MPSTTSISVWRPRASSTVMTPSLPTFSIASAMILPISGSLFAEMAPTEAISSLPSTGLAIASMASAAALAPSSMPRLTSIGLAPAVTFFETLAQDRLGEHGGGGGAVAGDVGGLGSDLARHLGAHVLERILELDLLGDGDAVLGDVRRAERLLEDHVAALGAEGDLDRVRELVDAAEDRGARVLGVSDLFGCHRYLYASLTSVVPCLEASIPDAPSSAPKTSSKEAW